MRCNFLAFLNDFFTGNPQIPGTYTIPVKCINCGESGRLILKKGQTKTEGLQYAQCLNCGFKTLKECQ